MREDGWRRGIVGWVLLVGLVTGTAWSDITYSLVVTGVWTDSIRARIEAAMDEALSYYNTFGSFNNHINVEYHPGVPTAEASFGSYLKFGGSISGRTAMHEIGHTLGVGTYWAYGANRSNGIWTGPVAAALIQEFDGPGATLRGDSMHIWPYGLNYDSEGSVLNRIRHVRILAAMRCDMGFLGFAQEPHSQVADLGDTVTFSVDARNAQSLQWTRDGQPISGATGPSLTLARVQAGDAGWYRCVARSGGESLMSRPARLSIRGLVGRWDFEGDLRDRGGQWQAVAEGAPGFAPGPQGRALRLDGQDDRVVLPAGIADAEDFTVACWVLWNGGERWQRIFDFGNNTGQYLFLTPRSGGDTLRFAIANAQGEQRVEASRLPVGQWVHLAVTLEGDTATLYVDGSAVASNGQVNIDPIDFCPVRNYLGDSQYSADPLFDGLLDDLVITNYALTAAEIQVVAAGGEVQAGSLDDVTGPRQTCLAWPDNAAEAGVWQIYMGRTEAEVAAADEDDGAYQGIRRRSQWITPILSPGQAIYWRADRRSEDGGLTVGTVRRYRATDALPTVFTTFLEHEPNLPAATAGAFYRASLAGAVVPGQDPRFSKLAGPEWVQVDPNGQVRGTPPRGTVGPVIFSVEVTDAAGYWDQALVSLEVTEGPDGSVPGLEEGLVAHWAVDNAAGQAVVDRAGGHAGRFLGGSVQWRPLVARPGRTGYALAFDGIDDAVDVTGFSGILGRQPRSCALWLKSEQGDGVLLHWGTAGPGGRWTVELDAQGRLQVAVGGGTATGTRSLDDGRWHHVAVVLPERPTPRLRDVALWVDGTAEPVTSLLDAAIDTQDGGALSWARSNSPTDGRYQGLMDDVRIAGRALLPQEIQDLAAAGLMLHLALDETGGTWVHDQSLAGWPGQVTGAPVWLPGEGTGGALQFDGVDDAVVTDCPGVLGGAARTCAAWVRTTAAEGDILAWGLDEGLSRASNGFWRLRLDGQGRLSVDIGMATVTASTPINDGRWHHVAAVLDDDGSPDLAETVLFVDGRIDPPSQVRSLAVDTSEDWTVHVGLFPARPMPFRGQIDDVRIYRRALSPDAVEALAR